jgi:hypothetical protein
MIQASKVSDRVYRKITKRLLLVERATYRNTENGSEA